jgi:hypothetical protein
VGRVPLACTVLATSHAIDPYGFAAQDPERQIESPDEIRNLMVLCEQHHRALYFGVHAITLPIWVVQRVAKPGGQITRARPMPTMIEVAAQA